jgi:nuclear pore complex protein Nup155
MRPPFLEAHLKREPSTVRKYQLLWQFYVKNGQPLRAAEVLAALAESSQSVPLRVPITVSSTRKFLGLT